MNEQFAYGVDLGWASQLEQQGYHWINEEGKEEDILKISKEMGADSVRLRVFVNPPEEARWQKRENENVMLGFCDPDSVLAMAHRVKTAGMRLMIDFHYSDHFADPQFQDMPEEWKDCSTEELCAKVHDHTIHTLQLLKDHGISPEWVQVGNEINHGILWPTGNFPEHAAELVRFLNAGYDAVKEVSPDTKVVTHLAELNLVEENAVFFDSFFGYGGKTDILGFSLYKYWSEMFDHPYTEPVESYLTKYHERYGKPVMIAEVGGHYEDPEGTYAIIMEGIRAAKAVSGEEGSGIFYWEPEVPGNILTDAYPLGAARLVGEHTIQYTRALTAYRDAQRTG